MSDFVYRRNRPMPFGNAVVIFNGTLHRGVNALNEWVRRRDEKRFRALLDFTGKEIGIKKAEIDELRELLGEE